MDETGEIAAFYAARLGEDESRANAMRHDDGYGEEYLACPATRTGPLGDLAWGEEACDCGLATRKGRALREVAAKRAVLADYQASVAMLGPGLSKRALALVKAVMTVWNDHPDYKEPWRP